MFSIPYDSLSFGMMPSLSEMLADPSFACPPSAGCRYHSHANYAPVAPRSVRRVVRVAPPPPRPECLEGAVRIHREPWGVALLIELPYFSNDEIR
jgi:hypothetical protein